MDTIQKVSNIKELKLYTETLTNENEVNEPVVNYRSFLEDKFLVATAVKRGVTNSLFEEISSYSPFDDQQWSDFLNINLRTLQRYKKESDHTFKPIQSEKIFELAEVINVGHDVFDTHEDFNIWLGSPSVAMGNYKPIELIGTSYGKDLVLAELNRIEYGVFV
jgi:putative toxin-antitoxin system antitoxin component (TIGR02293 family)